MLLTAGHHAPRKQNASLVPRGPREGVPAVGGPQRRPKGWSPLPTHPTAFARSRGPRLGQFPGDARCCQETVSVAMAGAEQPAPQGVAAPQAADGRDMAVCVHDDAAVPETRTALTPGAGTAPPPPRPAQLCPLLCHIQAGARGSDTSTCRSCEAGAGAGRLEVLAARAQVHPLGLSEQQEGAQPQGADSGHQIEHGGPGARGLDQVTAQAHAHDTCARRGDRQAEWQAGPALSTQLGRGVWWGREAVAFRCLMASCGPGVSEGQGPHGRLGCHPPDLPHRAWGSRRGWAADKPCHCPLDATRIRGTGESHSIRR